MCVICGNSEDDTIRGRRLEGAGMPHLPDTAWLSRSSSRQRGASGAQRARLASAAISSDAGTERLQSTVNPMMKNAMEWIYTCLERGRRKGGNANRLYCISI